MTTDPSSFDQRLLRRAFALARFARNQGNGPYGALCARADGSEAAEGENTEAEPKGDLTCHAEMNALREACREFPREALREFTMYASTEPCPMCAAAIALAGFQRLVFGASSARAAQVTGGQVMPDCRSVFALIGASLEVVGPLLEEEALEGLR